MVGGIVVEVCDMPREELQPDRLYVDVVERAHPHAKKLDRLAIAVVKNETSLQIEVGDAVWWQGEYVYWTPQPNRHTDRARLKCGVDYDIPIPRGSYSGITHPMRGNVKAK